MADILLDFDSPVDPTDKAKVNIQIFFVMFKCSLMYFNRVHSKERQLSDTLWSAVCCIRDQRSVFLESYRYIGHVIVLAGILRSLAHLGHQQHLLPLFHSLCQYRGCDFPSTWVAYCDELVAMAVPIQQLATDSGSS